jgi:uncharacterized protein YndB with AHSA1/START domain
VAPDGGRPKAAPAHDRAAPAHDGTSVTVAVDASPARAFTAFTAEIDGWWQRGLRFRNGGAGASVMRLEPGVGGRLIERVGAGADAREVGLGRVVAWDPPHGLELQWRNANFATHEWTRLVIRFEAVGARTHVTVRHHGWAALPPDHPARHGEEGAAFVRRMGRWWGDVLTALRLHLAAGGPP